MYCDHLQYFLPKRHAYRQLGLPHAEDYDAPKTMRPQAKMGHSIIRERVADSEGRPGRHNSCPGEQRQLHALTDQLSAWKRIMNRESFNFKIHCVIDK